MTGSDARSPIGERLMEIADPTQAELEIWLPVADAISPEPGARIDFFLNVAPEAPLSATVRQANHQATLSPGGVLAYRLKAELADKTRPPRIGCGTAKVHGDPVTLLYYLIRRRWRRRASWSATDVGRDAKRCAVAATS